MTKRRSLKKIASSALAASVLSLGLITLAPAGPAAADAVSFDLFAVTGTTTMPDGALVDVWGYNNSAASVDRAGGPVIEVTEGDEVTINFTNNLPDRSGVQFHGQEMIPDLNGVAANGGTTSYTFTASTPGTYLYEPALLPGAQYQTSMGLYGAVVVHSGTDGQAYDDPDTAYDQEAVLVLGEIDPALNGMANPDQFDMRKFKPTYTLMNGLAYPDTDPIIATGGSTVLLRYLNAGAYYRSMGALGSGQSVVALDGNVLDDQRHYVAETFGPGQSADALVTAPEQSSVDREVPIYDASLLLHNSNAAGAGGMMTVLRVEGAAPANDTVGPVASAVAYGGGNLTATIADTAAGGGDVVVAEYYLDDPSGAPTGTFAVTQAPSVDVSATAALPSGDHVFYVRGQDDSGNWGVFSSAIVNGGDAVGPTTRDASVKRNPANGAADVKVHATADDRQTGKSHIAAAEFSIDGGTPHPMDVNRDATIASVDGVIPAADVAALAEGAHEISIRSKDDVGPDDNWGPWLTSTDDPDLLLLVDKTGPVATDVTVEPNPNDGTLPINSATQAVRVSATIADEPQGAPTPVSSEIRKAEVFVDTVGVNGKGIFMGALDGVFDSTGEAAYADIPLATVAQLTNGPHRIYVHAQDQARNWGAMESVVLIIDKSGPVVTNLTATPNPTSGAGQVTLTADVSDALDTVIGGEWWIGSVAPADRNPMTVTGGGTGLTANVDVSGFAPGSYRIRVRAQDSLGTWGRRVSVVLVVN